MEFVADVKDLKAGLARVLSIAGKRSTLDILENVLVQAEEAGVRLTASDLEVTSVGFYPAKVAKRGAITIPAKKFFEMVSVLDAGAGDAEQVTVRSREKGGIEIVCGSVRFQLVGMSADEYPAIPAVDDSKFVSIDSKSLFLMIERTLYAASTDETRYSLNGVLFEPAGGDALKLVATDGHRLSLCEGKLEGAMKLGLKEGVIVPRKALSELVKLLAEESEPGKLAFTGSHCVYRGDKVTLITRLLEGQFPDYTQVIPVDNNRKARVTVDKFLRALRHTNPLATAKGRNIKIEISKGKLVATSHDPEIGAARDEFEIEYTGEPVTIGFNPTYLRDAVTAMRPAETVSLELSDDLAPAILRPEGDASYTCIIMPMRI